MHRFIISAFVLALSLLLMGAAPAEGEGQVTSATGMVQVKPFGAGWHDAAAGEMLFAGDRLKTGADGSAVVALPDGGELRVSAGTLFEVNDRRLDEGGSIALFLGRLWAKVQKAAAGRPGSSIGSLRR